MYVIFTQLTQKGGPMEFLDLSKTKKKSTAVTKTQKTPPKKEPLPPATQELDVQKALKQFEWVGDKLELMVEEANKLEITDGISLEKAVSCIGQAKKLYNKIESQKKETTKKARLFTSGVNNFCGRFTLRLEEIFKSGRGLNRKIGDYQAKVELDRRKKAKDEAEARAKLQDSINKEAEELGIMAPQLDLAPPPKEESTVARSNDGTSAFIKRPWTFEVQEDDKVPREYCCPDGKKIKDAVKGGIRNIPGVRIYQDIQTNVRVG